jgi:pimeloyl-ACP methyl ester carboxylesterase
MSDGSADQRVLPLPGGAELEYIVDTEMPDGSPLLVFHHGTPAAGPPSPRVLGPAREAGLQTVSLSRPGYGRSTRQPGRTVADVVPLVAALVDHLGQDRFVTAGWSGGGPHAIATTALMPDRCPAALSIASVAPYGAEGLDFLSGMGEENIEEFGAAVANPEALEAFLSPAAESMSAITGGDVIDAMATLLPEVDRALLRDGEGEHMAMSLRWSVEHGIWGWFDDDIAFVRPWGFDITEVRNPVIVMQGSADLMVPHAHGQWLMTNLAGGRAVMVEGEGHLSIVANHLPSVMSELRAALT